MIRALVRTWMDLLPLLVGIAVVAGAIALILVFETFPGRYARDFEHRRVVEGKIELRGAPPESSGPHAVLHPGCEFCVTRRDEREGWVYVIVNDGCAGWLTKENLQTLTERFTEE